MLCLRRDIWAYERISLLLTVFLINTIYTKIVKSIETNTGFLFMISNVIIIHLFADDIFSDTQVEILCSMGQTKGINEATPSHWQ